MSTSKSNSSQASSVQDNRSVVTNTSSSYDLSNRSSTVWADSSQTNSNNTSAYDLSNKSTNSNSNNTTNITTDGGAVAGALSLASGALSSIVGLASSVTGAATTQALNAYDYSDGVFHQALDFADTTNSRAMTAYDRAAVIEGDALTTVSKQSSAVIDQLQNAYADAKGTSESQQKIILAVLGLGAVAFLSRMG